MKSSRQQNCEDWPEYLGKFWRPKDLQFHRQQWKTVSQRWCKKLTRTIIIIIIIAIIMIVIIIMSCDHFGAVWTILKVLIRSLDELDIEGRAETIKSMTLLRSVRILRRVLETWGDLLPLRLQLNTISWCWYENNIQVKSKIKMIKQNLGDKMQIGN